MFSPFSFAATQFNTRLCHSFKWISTSRRFLSRLQCRSFFEGIPEKSKVVDNYLSVMEVIKLFSSPNFSAAARSNSGLFTGLAMSFPLFIIIFLHCLTKDTSPYHAARQPPPTYARFAPVSCRFGNPLCSSDESIAYNT